MTTKERVRSSTGRRTVWAAAARTHAPEARVSAKKMALCAMAALIAAPPAVAVTPPPAAAEPSADVCRALGYEITDEYGSRPSRAAMMAKPVSAPPPALTRVPTQRPSVQPPADASGTVEALIVTGQKREENIQDVPVSVGAFTQGSLSNAVPGNSDLMTAAPPPPPPPASLVASTYPAGPPAGTINRDRYEDVKANAIKRVAEEPVSTFSIDVDTASYSNVRRYLSEGQKPPTDAVRVEELINYFDYAYEAPRDTRTPFKATTAVVPSPWSKDRQIIHIGLQGYDIPKTQQPPLNLVFLIDTSGSMSGPDRLPLAKQALEVLIGQLRPQDRVSMVAYAGSAGAVLAPTPGKDKLRMRCALGALHSGGSTAGGEGLALAYALAEQNFKKGAVNRVILLTDGDFNVGVADPAKLEDFVAEKRKTGVYLSVYGFGRGNYNDVMMQTLAQAGNGTAAYIDTIDEGRRVFRDDFSSSLFPIADDVKIQVEFNPAVVGEYRLIGYETRMLNREDFNNDRVDAGEVGAGASVTALYEVALVGAPPSSDPLRYPPRRQFAPTQRPDTGEYAYLKVRYKLPGEQSSKLINRPITQADARTVQTAPESTRWALAVAAFGQKLRGDAWVDQTFGWNEVEQLAQHARGRDDDGARGEFVKLVRAARDGRRVNE